MTSGAVVAASLGSTGFAGLATALKHRSATHVAAARKAAPSGRLALLVATFVEPLWLLALLADAGAVGLQVTALHLGALAVVQPLLVTALLFSLLLNHLFARSAVSAREIGWAVLLIAALAAFLTVSGASSPTITGPLQAADKLPAELAAAAAVAIIALCLGAARLRQGVQRATLLGVAVGVIYASTAALLKACTNIATTSLSALFTSWQLYVVLVAGLAGLLLAQLAFQAGPLTASLPVIAAIDPVLSVAIGVVIYDEQLRSGLLPGTAAAGCLLLLAVAAFGLSRIGAASEDLAAAP